MVLSLFLGSWHASCYRKNILPPSTTIFEKAFGVAPRRPFRVWRIGRGRGEAQRERAGADPGGNLAMISPKSLAFSPAACLFPRKPTRPGRALGNAVRPGPAADAPRPLGTKSCTPGGARRGTPAKEARAPVSSPVRPIGHQASTPETQHLFGLGAGTGFFKQHIGSSRT